MRLDAVAAVGGGARSRFWMQLVAHVLGRPVSATPAATRGRLRRGAARPHGAHRRGTQSRSARKPPVLDVLEPDAALHAAYAARFRRSRPLSRAEGGVRRGVGILLEQDLAVDALTAFDRN